MDDRELEARLKTRLHARFDDAPVPIELAANVQQAFATTPTRVGFDLRSRGRWLGWSAVAAAVALVVVTGALGTLVIGGPGAKPTPSPAPSIAADRHFIVLPPTPVVPSKPETILAEAVLTKRLQALGFGTFTSSGGIEIQYRMPVGGPADIVVEDVLRATGEVEFIPLPPEHYGQFGDGPNKAVPGEPLPKDESGLFGWEGIESITRDQDNQGALLITLKEPAAAAFAAYTLAHVGETFAIVIDGRIASLPTVNEPIESGDLVLSMTSDRLGESAAAILLGGPLPDAWAHPVVPHVVPVERFISAIQPENPNATFVSAELGVFESNIGFPWVAVWRMTFEGEFPQCSATEPPPTFCPDGNLVVTVDASTGGGIP